MDLGGRGSCSLKAWESKQAVKRIIGKAEHTQVRPGYLPVLFSARRTTHHHNHHLTNQKAVLASLKTQRKIVCRPSSIFILSEYWPQIEIL